MKHSNLFKRCAKHFLKYHSLLLHLKRCCAIEVWSVFLLSGSIHFKFCSGSTHVHNMLLPCHICILFFSLPKNADLLTRKVFFISLQMFYTVHLYTQGVCIYRCICLGIMILVEVLMILRFYRSYCNCYEAPY